MKTIPIKNTDLVALVDDEDYEKVINYGPWALSDGYAVYNFRGNKGVVVAMHNLVKPISNDKYNEHKDRNRLNNQKENLRDATIGQNNCNKTKYTNNTSGYKGVFRDKVYNKWFARITIDGKNIYLGGFHDKDEAALAYNVAAVKYHGEFAVLNTVEGKNAR